MAEAADLFAWEEMPFAEQAGVTADDTAAIEAWAPQAEGLDFETLYIAAAQFSEEKRLDSEHLLELDIVTGPFFCWPTRTKRLWSPRPTSR